MTPEQRNNLKTLIDALRSGKYKQGQFRLAGIYDDKETVGLSPEIRHCCLGVACEVAIQQGLELTKTTSQISNTEISYTEVESSNVIPTRKISYGKHEDSIFLPREVQAFYGFDAITGKFYNMNSTLAPGESLSRMNDVGKSFDEIADALEAFLTAIEAPSPPPSPTTSHSPTPEK